MSEGKEDIPVDRFAIEILKSNDLQKNQSVSDNIHIGDSVISSRLYA